MIASEKIHLEKVVLLTRMRDLPEFLRSLRKIAGLRYEGTFSDWMEWVS